MIAGPVFMLNGGYHFDGQREITSPVRQEVEDAVCQIKAAGVRDIIVSSVFSPINNKHELQVYAPSLHWMGMVQTACHFLGEQKF